MTCASDLWLGFWLGLTLATSIAGLLIIGFNIIKERS